MARAMPQGFRCPTYWTSGVRSRGGRCSARTSTHLVRRRDPRLLGLGKGARGPPARASLVTPCNRPGTGGVTNTFYAVRRKTLARRLGDHLRLVSSATGRTEESPCIAGRPRATRSTCCRARLPAPSGRSPSPAGMSRTSPHTGGARSAEVKRTLTPPPDSPEAAFFVGPQLNTQIRVGVAQLVERRSPKPEGARSIRAARAYGPPRIRRAWTWHDLRTAQWNGMRSPRPVRRPGRQWGLGAAGSALLWHDRGRRFKSGRLHVIIRPRDG